MAYKGWNDKEKMDWDSIDSSGSVLVEEGVYFAVCKSAKKKATKDGKPALETIWQLQHNLDGEEVQSRIYDTLSVKGGPGGGAWKVKQCALATDTELPATNSEDDVEAFGDALVDAECWVRVIVDRYQEKDRNKIGIYMTEEEAKGDSDEPEEKPAKGKKPAADADDEDEAPVRRGKRR